jgi:hypothetical protein
LKRPGWATPSLKIPALWYDPGVRSQSLVLVSIAAGILASVAVGVPLARGQSKGLTIGVDEIKPGMKGYGLTVFRGTEPEKFDVEVVDVLHNFRPSQELILVKTPHPRLNVTKNVKGMSGSPIYLDGRLAGAYAYSWASFQVEPVAGVTPIAPMLTEMRRPIPPGFWPLEGGSGSSRAPLPSAQPKQPAPRPHALNAPTTFDGEPGEYDLEAHARQVAQRIAPPAGNARTVVPVGTPLMMAGVGDRTAAYVKKIFEPLGFEALQAGGAMKADPNAPQHYVDGGAIGVQLVSGDISFMGMGTVTHVEGNKLCAFGHPMMEIGNTALPTTIGRVLWIFASDQHSSKIGESVRPLGALVQDRQSAIVVDEKVTPPTFPVSVEVKGADGAPKKTWHAEVVEERFMSPGLTAAVYSGVIEATANERRDVTWNMRSKLTVRGHGTIELEDFGVATGGMPDGGDFARSRIVHALGDVLNNPWERTRIEKIESTLSLAYTRDLWHLRGVELLDSVVDAGQSARVRLRLTSYAGPEVFRVVELKVPQELAGKEVELEIAPGYDVSPDLASPDSLVELLANETRQSVAPRSVVAQIKLPSQGVAYRGHVAPQLPSFALDALRPASADSGPEAMPSWARVVVPLEQYIEGRDKVKIKVRPVLR